MKKQFFTVLLGISTLTGFFPPFGVVETRAQTSVSFQVFYDQLSPFGTWVSYPDYGYVWVPGAGSGFRPYATRGHWVYTEEGWTWVSDYSWGWATFHYGSWFYDDSYGWMWMPGYQWAPAWVTWGEYGSNYCWAPVGPRIDIGVSYSTYRPPVRYWNFCPRDRIASVNASNYYVNHVHNTTIVNNITVINNVNRGNGRAGYLRGPRPDNVERFTHSPVRPIAIQASARPGTARVNNGQLAIYRPSVQNNNAGVRPSRVQDLHTLRPVDRSQPAVANRPQPTGNRAGNPSNSGNNPGNRNFPHTNTHAPGSNNPSVNNNNNNRVPRNYPAPGNNNAPVNRQPATAPRQFAPAFHQPAPKPELRQPSLAAPQPITRSAPASRPFAPAPRQQPQQPATAPVRQMPRPMPQQRPAGAPAPGNRQPHENQNPRELH